MICSRNELEGALRKAAMGGGLAVGLAEEVARAGVWLCAQEWDGAGAVLAGIDVPDAPAVVTDTGAELVFADVRAAVAGPSALDMVVLGRRVRLLDADVPMLLLGLAGVAAEDHGVAFELTFDKVATAHVSASAVQLSGELPSICSEVVVLLGAPRPLSRNVVGPRSGIEVSVPLWQTMQQLAARTYVPATDASRMRGAGAGLSDND